MRSWEKQFPGRVDQIFAAMSRVTPSHLMDARRYDFVNLGAPLNGFDATSEGDHLFDPQESTQIPTRQTVIRIDDQRSGAQSLPDTDLQLS
jgi:tRNA 2-thiocytidine biosynthesis protein TtcA